MKALSKKTGVIARIRALGIIPVVRAPSTEEALGVVEAIRAGGLPILEITLTIPGAEQLIERLARAGGTDVLVGAGTVMHAESARACIAAGAQFIVSPILDRATVDLCRKHEVAVMAGALTPTEIAQAWAAGADLVKVFPASAVGGPAYIRSVKVVLPQVNLVPTGGVTLANVTSFLEAGAMAVGVGADLSDVEALRRGEAGKITAAAQAYVEAVRVARGTSTA
jgi:2-dehydro-3-deoxyphosphogluconate aldolase / (4S)-4-hydroxy-2-oxoglutarate aldolase